MDGEYLIQLAIRWVHIVSATLALGVPFYLRFALLPALGSVEEPAALQVREHTARRWRMWVHLVIVLLLATGFYTFLGIARWRDPETFSATARFQYHLLFGIKLLIALAMFFISSALAGRSAALASIRANAKTWLNVLILLGLVLILISGMMRLLPQFLVTGSAT